MSDIYEDIVKDVDIKPNKSKTVLKWVLRIGGVLVVGAFLIGQYKVIGLNKIDKLQHSVEELQTSQKEGFDNVNAKIDKVYADGYTMFDNFQQSNKKQLELIIDYGQKDKELVKRALDITASDNKQSISNMVQQAKTEPITKPTAKPIFNGKPSIGFKAVDKDYQTMLTSIAQNTKDTTFIAGGASKEFVDKINKKKYNVKDVKESKKYPGFYDVTFQNK